MELLVLGDYGSQLPLILPFPPIPPLLLPLLPSLFFPLSPPPFPPLPLPHLINDMFLGQKVELLVFDDSGSELQLSIGFRRLVGAMDGDDGGEETRRTEDQIGEDKLKSGGGRDGG